MSGMKTAEEKAKLEVERFNHKDPWIQFSMRKCGEIGYLAGHAEGLREAGELVEALESSAAKIDTVLHLMQSRGHQGLMGTPSILSEVCDNLHDALAAWKARGCG